MTTLTTEGHRLTEAMANDDLDPYGTYDGMGDPVYAFACTGSIVVYGVVDLGSNARINARELIDGDPDAALAWGELGEALEPMLEEASNAAEDANLENADPYKRAGAVACEWMYRNGLGRWDYTVEHGWSRGARVSIRRAPGA